MTVIETKLSFGSMNKRSKTTRIILHHAAATTCSVQDVHRWHKNNGWAGIGYHFFVRKDGSVYRGRPENTVGAHASGANSDSIGVCFEGNYQTETAMPDAQRCAGAELVAFLKNKYGISKVIGHRDTGSTSCPGQFFPFDAIAYAGTVTSETTQTDALTQFICEVQTAIGAAVDGIVGSETRGKLPTLSRTRNRKHRVVAVVQRRLAALGYSVGAYGADGVFGAATRQAVISFQRDHGLSADGIIGKNTWAALLAMRNS